MFGFNFDRKTLYIILAIIALTWIAQQGTAGILIKLLTLPAILIALTFHEFAHAYVAVKLRRWHTKSSGKIKPKSY